MCAISVIVPVYKAESYLRRCVDSLLAQTFTDFEILLIDDGSPDRSGQICDEYALQDERVRVIHKLNGGVASARQCGLDNAQGEYIIHADPDDWVESTMLEELYATAKKENADMVICDYYLNDQSQHYVKQQPSSLASRDVLRDMFRFLHGSCCNKLVKLSCYSCPQKISFVKDLNTSEDFMVNVLLLKQITKIAYVDKAFYHYDLVINSHSITRKMLSNHLQQDKLIIRTISQILPEKEYIYERSTLIAKVLFHIVQIYDKDSASFKHEFGKYKEVLYKAKYAGLLPIILVWLSCSGLYGWVQGIYKLRNRLIYRQ